MKEASKLAFKPRLKATERRRIIEQAAAELFAARGYEATSLDDIAHAAGVTKRVIYDHFASKRELQTALLRMHTDALLAFVAPRVTVDGSPQDRMSAGVEAFFRFVEEHPYAWRMLFRDPPTDPHIAATHREVQDRATAAIAGFLATAPLAPPGGTEAGHWLEMQAEQLKAALNGLAGWWYAHPDVPRACVVAAAMDFTWSGMANQQIG